MNELKFRVTNEQDGERIDKYVSILNEDISRSYIQKLMKEENITVNGTVVKANYRVKEDDEIIFLLPDSIYPNIEAEDISLTILYEDEDLLIVNKPKGMVVHPSIGHYNGTMVNGLMYHCKGQLSGINGVMRPGIVHRIDKDTTGSVIVCKNDFSHNDISRQLKEHTIVRKYRAIVHGNFDVLEGTIIGTIGRHPNDRKKMAMNVRLGKEAITHYKVLQQFEKFAYVECQLETGRTHQIRVHMTSINHPLLGDVTYGNLKSPFTTLNGQTLHAMTLGFIHPRTKEYMEIEAPLPDYFEKLLDVLK
ncbi:MAG TPA: RluA family pseudouridine synthase [Lachnospiraceae bacterium]|nr:RluA family pseudouridine synthase [Lachnospiraceae bacterium]